MKAAPLFPMGQRDTLQKYDGVMAAAFRAAGLADGATYDGGNGVVPVTVYVDELSQSAGDDAMTLNAVQTLIRLLRSEVPSPARGASVTVDGKTYTLLDLVEEDQSLSTWSVEPTR